MKLFCEFCGASINTEIDNKCPHCGADFSQNQHVKAYHNFQNDIECQKQQYDLQQEYLKTEQIKNRIKTEKSISATNKVMRIGCLIPIIIFTLAIICGVIISLVPEFYPQQNIEVPTEPEYVEPYHKAVVGETISTKDYELVCDKWEYYTPNSYAIQKGEKYICFHFVLTNTTDSTIIDDEGIYCYDSNGSACSTQASISNELRNERFKKQNVPAGKSHSGWVYYIIPSNEKNVTIMFGEKIEINIDLTQN